MDTPDLFTRCLGYLPALLDGALNTLWVAGVGVGCGFLAGILLHRLLSSTNPWFSRPARVYVSIIRGTPVLVQLLVCFYLPSALGVEVPGLLAATIGLSLNSAAYQSQILGAGFAAIPRGQIEAARTFNLSRSQTLWHVEVPQVLALTLPALVSEMIDVVKASAVVSVISVTDLMRVGQQLSSSTYRPLEVYSMAALCYLALTSLLSLAAWVCQRRLARR
ncbi:amino acid ABC transporter permease [Uliginosibacterium paludis]|uniref:Amino acid ABC transporter permease n=1 Tax=Uliginosibacterium paludis TaxID=1615952 RepID=A0ABV2CS78_9RHOO